MSGQSKLQAFLPEIASYVSSVPRLCCTTSSITPSLAYRLVARDGRILDDFKFEAYSEDVVRKVMTSSLREPTFFNAALLRSFEAKFRAESRTGVKVSWRRRVWGNGRGSASERALERDVVMIKLQDSRSWTGTSRDQ